MEYERCNDLRVIMCACVDECVCVCVCKRSSVLRKRCCDFSVEQLFRVDKFSPREEEGGSSNVLAKARRKVRIFARVGDLLVAIFVSDEKWEERLMNLVRDDG